MIGSVLRGRGMEVLTARNGVDALQLALEKRPHVIVTDYQMPRMDGLQLAQRLRAEPATAETPVIMLTARGHKLSAAQLQLTCIHQLMTKPFSARELVSAILEVLEQLGIEHDDAVGSVGVEG